MMIVAITMFGLFAVSTFAEEPPFPGEEFFEGEDHERRLSEEEVLGWLEQHLPEHLEELRQLQRELPEEYEEEIFMIGDMIGYWEELKHTHPEMFERMLEAEKLERRSWQIADEIARAEDDTAKQQFTTELRNILTTIFDIRMEERALEIREIEQELQEMKAIIEKRQAMKQDIIDRHLQEMLSDVDDALGWW